MPPGDSAARPIPTRHRTAKKPVLTYRPSRKIGRVSVWTSDPGIYSKTKATVGAGGCLAGARTCRLILGRPSRHNFPMSGASRSSLWRGVCHHRPYPLGGGAALDLPGRPSGTSEPVRLRGDAGAGIQRGPRPRQPAPATSCSLENVSRVKEQMPEGNYDQLSAQAPRSQPGHTPSYAQLIETVIHIHSARRVRSARRHGAEKPDREARLFRTRLRGGRPGLDSSGMRYSEGTAPLGAGQPFSFTITALAL